MRKKHRLSLLAASLSLALIPSARSAVTFQFDYSDPSAALWSPEARAVLEKAGQKVASYLVNHTATVVIGVSAINDTNDITLAYAAANFDLTGGNLGFNNPGAVANKILSNGTFDENGPDVDGIIGMNLGRTDVSYANIVGANEADFYTAMIHELTHTLGIFGNISEAGAPVFDGYYVPYSQFLANAAGEKMVKFNTLSGIWEVDVPLWQAAVTGGMYFDGPNAVAANNGNLVRLYTPSVYSEGASLVHLDEATFGKSILTPFLGHGPGVHDLSGIELGMLQDLGYTVPEPGSALLAVGAMGLGLRRRRPTK